MTCDTSAVTGYATHGEHTQCQLAHTGFDVLPVVLGGVGMILLGVLLVWWLLRVRRAAT